MENFIVVQEAVVSSSHVWLLQKRCSSPCKYINICVETNAESNFVTVLCMFIKYVFCKITNQLCMMTPEKRVSVKNIF